MPRGRHRDANNLPDRICAYGLCRREYKPTQANQRYCDPSCGKLDRSEKSANSLRSLLQSIADRLTAIEQRLGAR